MWFGSWVRKSFIFGMTFTLGAPLAAHAYSEPSVIEAYVGRQALVPLIKPGWGNFIQFVAIK